MEIFNKLYASEFIQKKCNQTGPPNRGWHYELGKLVETSTSWVSKDWNPEQYFKNKSTGYKGAHTGRSINMGEEDISMCYGQLSDATNKPVHEKWMFYKNIISLGINVKQKWKDWRWNIILWNGLH